MVQQGYGKHKGNNFENQIYKDLRDVIPDIKKTIGSGNSERDSDLISNDFIFELKRYKKIDESMIREWWMKVFDESILHEREPVIIYKENFKPIKVVLFTCIRDKSVMSTINYDEFKEIVK